MPDPGIVCGWDLGGAHLKVAQMDPCGTLRAAAQFACPLWQGMDHLRDAIEQAQSTFDGPVSAHAISMTGELCDNFASREDGVRKIVAAASSLLRDAPVHVYGRGAWFPAGDLPDSSLGIVASANWDALARAAAQAMDRALLIDIGSTTTDLIPLIDGVPAAVGSDDATRLQRQELLYTGIARTALMALSREAPYAGEWQGVAAEYFATTADVYRVLGELPPNADLHPAADNGRKDVDGSAQRIARMLGRDYAGDLRSLRATADYFAYCQFDLLQRAYLRVASSMPTFDTVIAAGAGSFLVERLAAFNGKTCRPFATLFAHDGVDMHDVATAAPAVALARLRLDALAT